jgi:hypothetical protein
MLTVPPRSSKRKSREGKEKTGKPAVTVAAPGEVHVNAATSASASTSTVVYPSSGSTVQEIGHDKLDTAMSAIFSDIPRAQWVEEEELQLLGRLLDAGPNDLDNFGFWSGTSEDYQTVRGTLAAFVCLSPILEQQEEAGEVAEAVEMGREKGMDGVEEREEGDGKKMETSGTATVGILSRDSVLNSEWQVDNRSTTGRRCVRDGGRVEFGLASHITF